MRFEWNQTKAHANKVKHDVSFGEAASVFRDPFAMTFDDPDHSLDERRYITLGMSVRQRVLFVAHVQFDEDGVRLISAREATAQERNAYQETRR